MSRGSGSAIITGATATAIAEWYGAPAIGTTIITTITTGIIITGIIITGTTTGIVTDVGASLRTACGAKVGPAAGLPSGRPADFVRRTADLLR
jgi:hypothetical protein